MIGSIIGVALCVILYFILDPIKPDKRNSVVLLQCHYHYELIKDNKVEAKTKSYPYFGTGFFISKDGKIVTNLHIAKPWLFEEDDVKAIKTAYLTKEYGEMGALLTSGLYEVRGVMDYVAVYPHGSVYSEQNAIKAHVIAASENKDVDLAILQLDSNVLPSTSDYISVSDISKSADDVDVGDKVCAIGFPTGLYLQIEDDEQARDQKRLLLESYKTEGIVIRSGTDVNFEHNAMTEGGSSGSPIFDSRGNVVGVNSAHKSQAESNNNNIAIDAALIHGLLNRKVKY